MAKKFKPTVGMEISFYQDKEKRKGTVTGLYERCVTVYPSTAEVRDSFGKLIDMEHFVETANIIGEVS
jgi:hypothetical protein